MPLWALVVVLAYGAGSLGGVLVFRRRPLDPSGPDQLAVSFRSLFLTQMAFATAPAVMGFVFQFVVGARWPVLLGMGFSAVGLTLAAPTRGDIRRRQEQITASGSLLSLEETLITSPAGS